MDFTALSRIAVTQHGLITAGDFVGAEFSRRVIERLERDGVVTSVHQGVWRVGVCELGPVGRLAAALLAAGPEAVASHRSALSLWGVPSLVVDSLDVLVPRRRNPRVEGVTVRRSDDLAAGQVRVVEGLRVTSPARTLVDAAGVVPRFVVERALEDWLTRKVVTVPDVELVVTALARRGRRGVSVARSILESRALGLDAADSFLEVHTAKLLRAAGLDAVFHHQVTLDNVIIAELDFAFVAEQVYLESDGFGFHSSRDAFDRDRARQNLLSEIGWLPVRFNDRQLRTRDHAAMETTRRILAARRTELGSGQRAS